MPKARSPAQSAKLAAFIKRRKRMRASALEDEHPIIGLQQSVGNEATQRMLKDGAANRKQESDDRDDGKDAAGSMALMAALALMPDGEEAEEPELAAFAEAQAPAAKAEAEPAAPADLGVDALPKLTAAAGAESTPDYGKYMSPYSQEHDTQGGYGGVEASGALPSDGHLTELFGYGHSIPGEADKDGKKKDEKDSKKEGILAELNPDDETGDRDLDEALESEAEDEDKAISAKDKDKKAIENNKHPGKEQEELQRKRDKNGHRIRKQQKARRKRDLLKQ